MPIRACIVKKWRKEQWREWEAEAWADFPEEIEWAAENEGRGGAKKSSEQVLAADQRQKQGAHPPGNDVCWPDR